MSKKCLMCCKELDNSRETAKYCSQRCKGKYKTKISEKKREKTCPICLMIFVGKNIKTKCCSISCRSKLQTKVANENKKKICTGCKKEFIARDKTKIYCNRKCFYQSVFTKPKSKEHKRKIAEAQKNVRVEGEFYCNRCGAQFISNTSVRAHKAHCQHTVAILICPKCKKKCKGNAGLKAHQIWCFNDQENIRKRKTIKEAVKQGNIRRILSGNQNRSINTDIEIIFENNLKKNNINYEHPFLFKTDRYTHLFDFYFPDYNLLIEVDGDYWHGNKGPLVGWQLRQIKIDRAYTKAAVENGFLVIRFWGSAIKKNCWDCIKEAISYGETNQSRINGVSRDIRSWY